MTLGERLKVLRARQGLTQPDLSRLAHVDRTLLFRLEAGQRDNLSLKAAKRLALSLGVSLDVLAGMHEETLDGTDVLRPQPL